VPRVPKVIRESKVRLFLKEIRMDEGRRGE